MVSSQFTVASLLAVSTLASAGASQDLHALFARQSGGSGTCLSQISSGCESDDVTEAGCRNAVCGTACLAYLPSLSSCCNTASTLIQLSNCVVDLAGGDDGGDFTTTSSSATGTRATGSRTSSGAGSITNTATSTLSTAAGGGGVTVSSTSGSPATTSAPSGTIVVSVATNASGQPIATSTLTKTGGVDHVAVGQLGVAGSALAWALSFLLL